MPKPEIEMTGEKELAKALEALGSAVADKLEGIAHAGATPVKEAAKDKAPQLSGDLSDKMTQETLEKSKTAVEVGVGPDKDTFWGLFIEFGVGAHHVKHVVAQALQIEQGFAVSADIPAIPAQPFLRPALDENIDAAINAIAEEAKKVLGL